MREMRESEYSSNPSQCHLHFGIDLTTFRDVGSKVYILQIKT